MKGIAVIVTMAGAFMIEGMLHPLPSVAGILPVTALIAGIWFWHLTLEEGLLVGIGAGFLRGVWYPSSFAASIGSLIIMALAIEALGTFFSASDSRLLRAASVCAGGLFFAAAGFVIHF